MANAHVQTLEKLESLIHETLNGNNKSDTLKVQELLQKLKRSYDGLKRFSLEGQVALVTGGGQGIGRAFALALGEAGAKVAVADLAIDRSKNVAAELEAKGVESLALSVDVSKKDDVEKMVQAVLSKFGDLHIACNNAGIVFHSNSEDTSEVEWNKTLAVNLSGVYYSCQAEAKHMLKKGYGRIINTASMSASIVNHPQKQTAYNTSKAGVVHMTKSLGAEWAERGVTVNCISPGYVDTELNRSEHLLAVRALWERDTPMQRLCNVEELTGAVVYLASPSSSYTTGLDMIIDGGFTCW